MKIAQRPVVVMVAVATLLLVVVVVAFVWLAPASGEVPLPVPNGYAYLLQAGVQVRLSSRELSQLSQEELDGVVRMNSAALQTARTGLTHQSRVILDYIPESQQHIQDLSSLKGLAHAFRAEAQLALLNSRTNDAAISYVDGVRVGVHSARGGTVIDVLVGLAIENLSARTLPDFVESLDAATARKVAQALEQVENERESLATILENERRWSRRTFGYRGQVIRVFTRKQTQKTESMLSSKLNPHRTLLRQIMLQSAARAFALEKGRELQSTRELVPDYLASVPRDAVSGQELRLP